jgi:hypothetical protein
MPDEGMMPDGQAAAGEAAGSPPQGGQQVAGEGGAQPAAEPTIQDVIKQLQGLQPHIGRISALQSKLDSIPKALEDLVAKRFEAFTRQNQLNQLPIDQRKAYEEEQAQYEKDRRTLFSLMDEHLNKVLPERFGPSLAAGEAHENSVAAQGFFSEIESSLGPEELQRIAPYINELIKKNADEIRSTDTATFEKASEWLDKAMKNPSSVALQALRMAQEAVQKGADNVVQQREARGRALGAAPRPGSTPAPPKTLKGMSPKELEALAAEMPTADFEKLVKASKG